MDIDYDFPKEGDPTIRIKAHDKGFNLAGRKTRTYVSGCTGLAEARTRHPLPEIAENN